MIELESELHRAARLCVGPAGGLRRSPRALRRGRLRARLPVAAGDEARQLRTCGGNGGAAATAPPRQARRGRSAPLRPSARHLAAGMRDESIVGRCDLVRLVASVDRGVGAGQHFSAAGDGCRVGQARGSRYLGGRGAAAAAQRSCRGQQPARGRRARYAPALDGLSDGGRALTVVIERTVDPTTWLIVTGWSSTAVERKLLERR